MIVDDLGPGTCKRGVRLYTHQDHYNGDTDCLIGPVCDPGCGGECGNFVAQDVMEYSVWGSNTCGPDLAEWTLISDVTGFDNSAATVNGNTPPHANYSFGGLAAAPQTI